MRPWSRGRRVEHARYVGLQSVPEPPRSSLPRRIGELPSRTDRAVNRRLAALGGVALVGLVATVTVAATLSGSPARSAGQGAPATSASTAPIAALGASPSPLPLASLAPGAPSPTPGAPAGATGGLTGMTLPTGYRWPLDHGRITTAFAPQLGGLFYVDGVAFHDGIDIATYCGDRVNAAHDGVVIASGRHVEAALGWVGDVAGYEAHLTAKQLWGAQAVMVITDDGNGYRSVYVHLFQSLVKVGQEVKAGDRIGWEGRTGDATGCHLHYSIFSPADPGRFITDPKIVKRSDLPAAEIARIDPLTVLPPMSTTDVTWGWGAKPSSGP
jgi:murein DD-endopeptidase MepM/ murein hydrolase activator NlpD